MCNIPRLSSRPKVSCDQTFQTRIISDLTFQTGINPDQTFQTQVTSDLTFQTQRVSDHTFQSEGVLIRPSSDYGPDSNSDHCPDLNQTVVRLKCTLYHLCMTQVICLIRERFYYFSTNLLILLHYIHFIEIDVCSIYFIQGKINYKSIAEENET